MTDSSKKLYGNRTLTAIGAVMLVHLLLLSTANASSPTFVTDVRDSKLEDDWKPMSDYRHIRYITNASTNNVNNVTATLSNGTIHNGYRNVTDRNIDYIACLVNSKLSDSFNIRETYRGDLRDILKCYLIQSDLDSRENKSTARSRKMINSVPVDMNESYLTKHANENNDLININVNNHKQTLLDRLMTFKNKLRNVLIETENKTSKYPKGSLLTEDTIMIHSLYKEGDHDRFTTFKVDKNKLTKTLIRKLVSTDVKKSELLSSLNSNSNTSDRSHVKDKSKLRLILESTNDRNSPLFNKEIKPQINVQIINPNVTNDLDIEDKQWSKIVFTTPKTNEPVNEENSNPHNETKTNADLGILNEFISNSLSDLRVPVPEHHNQQLIVSGPVHESLDDLILHHTSTSVSNPHQNNPSHPRPSVILIHDVPDEFLPKPPQNYHTTTPVYQYIPPQPNPVHVQINNFPTSSSVYRPHEPAPEPEPEYVPIINNPKPDVKPSHKPIYSYQPSTPGSFQHKPSIHHYPKPSSDQFSASDYHHKPYRPSIKPIHNSKPQYDQVPPKPLYKPVHYDPIPEPESANKPGSNPPLYKPVHYDPIPEPEPAIRPGSKPPFYKPGNYDPIPEPEPTYSPGSRPPFYKPVHYDPIPEPSPEPVHVPVYLYPKPEPIPEVQSNYGPSYDVHRPIYSSTIVPSPKPIDPYVTTPAYLPPPNIILSSQTPTQAPLRPNTSLGPTLIFVNTPSTPATPERPADPPVPSPLNPLTIPSGKPPPSIVLLPPLSDQTSLQSSPVCPTIFVTNNQNIHTSADFKTDCPSNVNVIINAPVSASAGDVMPISSEDYEESEEDNNSEGDNEPSNDQGGGGGGTALIVPAPIPVVPGVAGGGGGGTTAVVGGNGGALGSSNVIGAGAPVAAAAAGSGSVTTRPTQNTPIQSAVTPIPTKRPQSVSEQSMSLWDYISSVLNSLVLYPLWTVVFGPVSLLVASGLGVATLVFPWAFPRFWFGRRRRKRRAIPILEFEPIISSLDYSAAIFETRLKTGFEFHRDYNR